jgi:molybdopterin converting factor small subunit
LAERALEDWLTGYIQYTRGSEPPLAYHTWLGVSMIAGALQRKAYLQMGFEKIFPNMYIVLVGPSGRARKGIALGIGKDLLSNISGVVMTSENATREALIRCMKGAVINSLMPDGKVIFHCSVTCFSEELSVFLGQNDIKFLASLTDWYDSKDNWTYETKSTGKDHLQGLCFNLLGATAPEWLQSMLPQEAIGGGFTSRVIFVVEEQKSKTVPEHILSDEEKTIREALISDLTKINNIAGEFRRDPACVKMYNDWYQSHDKAISEGRYPVEDERFAGYAERRATHIRKLMLIMSASRSDSRIITTDDFQRADKLLKATELKMSRTFGGLGKARYADVTEKVIDYISKVKIVSRKDLMRKFYRDVDMATMKIIDEVMDAMQVVTFTITESGDKIYTWKGKT